MTNNNIDVPLTFTSFKEVEDELEDVRIYDHLKIFFRGLCLERKFGFIQECVRAQRFFSNHNAIREISKICEEKIDIYAVEASTYETECSKYEMFNHAQGYCKPVLEYCVKCLKENNKYFSYCAPQLQDLRRCIFTYPMLPDDFEATKRPFAKMSHSERSFFYSDDFIPLNPAQAKWPYHVPFIKE